MQFSAVSSFQLVLLLRVILFSLADAKSSGSKLAALCKGEQVKVRSIRQLESLVGELETAGEECTKTVKDALMHLEDLTVSSEAGICTMEKAQAITQFIDTYLKRDHQAADQTDGDQQLPRPLVKFAIAYGMKISGICGEKMVTEFALEAKKKLKFNYVWISHYELLKWYISDKSPLGSVLEPLIKTGEVILPVDLMQALSGMAEHSNLMVPKALGLTRLKVLCEQALRPLYEPLLLPLAHLIRAGFNNRQFYWQRKYKRNARFWSRAVFLCEISKAIEFDPEQQVSGGEEAEIAAEMKRIMESVYDARGELMPWEEERKPRLEPLPLQPSQVANTIYGPFDFTTKSLVKAFDANKDYVELLRERILKRSFRILRRIFRGKGLGKVLPKILKFSQPKETKLNEARDELIGLMEAPKGDSRAYKWLVKFPKWIKDALLFCILVAMLFLPGLVALTFAPKSLRPKLSKGLDVVVHDWLHYH